MATKGEESAEAEQEASPGQELGDEDPEAPSERSPPTGKETMFVLSFTEVAAKPKRQMYHIVEELTNEELWVTPKGAEHVVLNHQGKTLHICECEVDST
eukprot:4831075-Amphidinium_carterae.1